MTVSDPDVVPLQCSGIIDIDLTKLTSDELMTWGINNLAMDSSEGVYSVRHGSKPVQDFVFADVTDEQRNNIFEKAFLCLFPYGCGGIESRQFHRVDFTDHVRWALRYHDRRFHTHESFPFVTFGIQQRRQALSSARIQMERRCFDRDIRLLSGISLESLKYSTSQEEQHRAISDPGVLALKKHVYGAVGRVQGSDQSRYQLRSQIWSTTVSLGPPSLWITINPWARKCVPA